MPSRSSTRKPKEDFSQVAFRLVQQLTGEKPTTAKPDVATALDSAELRKEVMREMGKRGGQKGGKSRAEILSPARRSEIAKKAASARWKNLDEHSKSE